MERYILKTILLEKPDIVFYYKGTEDDENVCFALNSIVSLSKDEALIMDLEDARKLLEELKCDNDKLIGLGYNPFEIINI